MKTLWVILGFIVALGLVAIVATIAGKKEKNRHEYDERQMEERGKAFRVGFFAYIGYFVLQIFFAAEEVPFPVDDVMAPMLGMLIGLCAMTSYAIWHDAYVGMSSNKRQTYTMLICVGLANFLIGLSNLLEHKAIVDGVLTYRSINLVIGIMFAYLTILYAVKNALDNKEAADEES